jgi:hypothetical protein
MPEIFENMRIQGIQHPLACFEIRPPVLRRLLPGFYFERSTKQSPTFFRNGAQYFDGPFEVKDPGFSAACLRVFAVTGAETAYSLFTLQSVARFPTSFAARLSSTL